jgi:drug/metabolite transporter (DMT)-like permease
MRRFRDLRPGLYLTPTCLLALGAAIGTTGYSMLDDEALRVLRGATSGVAGTIPVTLLYACLEGLTTALWLGLFICTRAAGRADLRELLRHNRGTAIGAGIVIYLTYSIVLVSLAFVDNVSYVVAFRQLSIPIGAFFGILLLKEPAHIPKLLGLGLMFLGLVLVATG